MQKKTAFYQNYNQNGTKFSSMYRIALLTEKNFKSAIKAQQILQTLVRNATSTMFQNKKLKRNPTSAITEVAEVALCPPLLLTTKPTVVLVGGTKLRVSKNFFQGISFCIC